MANKPATAQPAVAAKTKPFRVLQNLRHNGKHYNPGSKVQLAQKEAAELRKRNVVEPWTGNVDVEEEAPSVDAETATE
jgi:hypothetical protein